MSEKKKILIQLDSDTVPSVFDRVVAVDSGADFVFSYAGVRPQAVRDLVYGAIFTRGGGDLRRTAIFIGGSDVSLGEKLARAIEESFVGPLKVSVLVDSGGANTTAAAAVLIACQHADLSATRALVLGATGPVGRRVARLLAGRGAAVSVGSRSLDRACRVAEAIRGVHGDARVEPVVTEKSEDLAVALDGIEVVVSAGGPGARLLPLASRLEARSLRLAIDLNAVPPEGIEGVKGTDSARERDGAIVYGAIAVGGLKMKIHKAAVRALFEANDRILDAEDVLELGAGLA